MRAAILQELNSPLLVDNVELTEPQIGQVIVKVLVSGLCGAQLQEIRGEKNNKKFLPHLLGHEGCGIVQQIGPGVTRVSVGDKVIMHWRKTDGIESNFPNYIYKNKKITSGKVTTLSEYSIVSENRLTVVPHDTPNNLCALLGCGLSTALGTINNVAKIKFGETVLIIGCGGVGLNLIQGARLANAGDIYAIDITNNKKNLVEFFGAIFLNVKTQAEEIALINKINCIIDTTGIMEQITAFLPKLDSDGRVVLVCQPKENSYISFTKPGNFFVGDSQTILSTQGGRTIPSIDFPRYVKLYNSGKINIDQIVTHTFKLDDINTAVQTLKSGSAGRIIIDLQ